MSMDTPMPKIDDDKLQQLLDEELAEPESAELRAILEGSDVDQGRARAVARVGEFVREICAAEELTASETESLFAAVQAGIEAQAESAPERKRPKLRLIEGEGLGTLPPKTEKVAFEPKSGREGQGGESRKSGVPGEGERSKWPAIFATVAIAAAAILAVVARPDPAPPIALDEPTPLVVDAGGPEESQEDEPPAFASLGSEVVEVDFGANTGAVFQVPGEQDVPVAVVWLSDEEIQ